MLATIFTPTGTKELSGLPASFKDNLHNAPYYLEVAAIAGKPVIEHCDCCGHLICKGEPHTSNKNGVWCSHCMPKGC